MSELVGPGAGNELADELELLAQMERADLVVRLLELNAQLADEEISADEFEAARDELYRSA